MLELLGCFGGGVAVVGIVYTVVAVQLKAIVPHAIVAGLLTLTTLALSIQVILLYLG